MKKPIFIFILILFLTLLVLEGGIIVRHGMPPFEPDPPEFKYQYVDIYKKFFKKVRKGDKYVYIAQRLRNNSTEFPVNKAPDTIRIFIIGGSAAYNFGYFTFKSILEGLIPNRNFEVINCGMGAYDSYRTYLVEKEILSHKPDLIIVLSGNNEFYNKVKINLWSYYLNKFLRKSWIYRRLQDRFLEWYTKRGGVYFRDKGKRLIDYEKNIRLMVQRAKTNKVPIILCSSPVNFSDCPPIGKRPLDKHYFSGHFLLEQRDYPNAISEFKNFLKYNSDNCFGFYFMGCAYEEIKNYPKAKECYLKILELDYGNGRASPKSNEIIRQICTEERVGLADLELAFINITPHGLLGRKQFYDDCHWYMEYNSLVAEVIIRAISRCSNIFGSSQDKLDSFSLPHNFPSLKECGKREDEVEGRIKAAVWEVLREGDGVSERAISYFETLYLMNPDSIWEIQFLKDRIKKICLEDVWIRGCMSNFDRRWPCVLYHIGETYRRMRLYEESLKYFRKAISLDENDYLSFIGCALTYYALGDKQKAWENINKAGEISENLEVKCYKEILGF